MKEKTQKAYDVTLRLANGDSVILNLFATSRLHAQAIAIARTTEGLRIGLVTVEEA